MSGLTWLGDRRRRGQLSITSTWTRRCRTSYKPSLASGVLLAGPATTGNITPFIGLPGTVLGIIDSFREIGTPQAQASIAAVAPGVSEALVATAAGLFTAIPAVILFIIIFSRAFARPCFGLSHFTVEAMRSLQTRLKQTPAGVQ